MDIIISRELAQSIVDSIMPMAGHNINIMNSEGVIIGSGEPDRINTVHQGAVAVLRSGTMIEIDEGQVACFPGARTGLNWPIVLGGRIVGVVGVSGDPHAVRDTASLVKMVAELLLERESLVEEFRANLLLREQFIQLLLTAKSQENERQITRIAGLLRFQLAVPRVVAVVSMEPFLAGVLQQHEARDLITSRTEEEMAGRLDGSEIFDKKYDLYIFSKKEIIILKHFPEGSAPGAFDVWAHRLRAELDPGEKCADWSIGLGGFAQTADQIRTSYREAVFALSYGTKGRTVASIYDFSILADYLLEVTGNIEECLAIRHIKTSITQKMVTKYDMVNTVRGLLDNNLNVSLAAEFLHIHRNTLVFRLEKLRELTSLSPAQSFQHAVISKIIFGKLPAGSR